MRSLPIAGKHGEVSGDPSATLRPISLRSMFWRPNYLNRSAWIEHLPFAFWVIEAHRPRVLVELGTQYGVSYFGFCQAVERLSLDTRCYAVDTWKGDEHAGFYGEEVFNTVNNYNNSRYSSFSRLIRSTFDQAINHFSDSSIDLLHIDGLHTLDAVTRDFENWLPKLSAQAIVLFHDTNVRERHFGVYKLFERLRVQYPAFEFIHGHGLGVLAVGGEQADMLERLFRADGDNATRQALFEVFGRLGRACADAYEIGEREKEAQRLKQDHSAAARGLEEQKAAAEKRNVELSTLTKQLENELARSRAESAAASARVIELERAKSEIERLNNSIESERNELKRRNQEQSIILEEINSALIEEKLVAKDAISTSNEISNSKALLQQSHDTLKLELTYNIKALEKAASQRDEARAARAAAKIEQRKLEKICARLKTIDSTKNQEINDLKVALGYAQSLSEEIETERKRLVTQNLDLTSRLAEHRSENLRLKGDYTKQNSISIALENEIVALRSEVTKLKTELGRNKQNLSILDRENSKIEAEFLNKHREIARLTELYLDSIDELDRRAGQIEGLQAQMHEMERNIVWRLNTPWRLILDAMGARRSRIRRTIENSGLFDAEWYQKYNPDVVAAGYDPLDHFLSYGGYEGRDPSERFSTSGYLRAYSDVEASGINALVHYVLYGRIEGRSIGGLNRPGFVGGPNS
jgi:hypothetical protein